ncbi:TolC family protein [Oribacterium sp. WCC10]|uniref:TolC family protein n=1 Tax=Oribacterium sp. WCC10 TaxID=1855343 RepID=UPI0008E8C474|nr:TolC family protein [Oribacterium sp. WCC10]SFG34869.1 hypothetical protein SAMN05216356_10685 [Oribacterium sp. WCC10]
MKKRIIACVLTASMLGTLASGTVMAETTKKPGTRVVINVTDPFSSETGLTGVDSQGRPNGMDDETWARLQDNVIDYDEIPDLVEYRSVIARQQTAAIDNYAVNMNQIIDSISDSIGDMNAEITDLREKRNEETDAAKKAEYDAMIKLYNSMISASGTDNYGIVSTDETGNVTKTTMSVQKATAQGSLTKLVSSIKKNMHATKVSMISGMNSAFLGYQSLLELNRMYQKQVDMYRTMYDAVLRQQAVGSATAADVRSAEISLREAELNLSGNNESLRSIKENMALLLGWDISEVANVSIGVMPQYDATYIASRDLNADIETARMYNVSYGSAAAMKKPDITGYSEADIKRNSTKENLNITMNSLYNTALQAGSEYDAALAGYMVAARQKDAAERSYAAGLVGNSQYAGAVTQYIASEAQANISAINASSAVLNYQAALKGYV